MRNVIYLAGPMTGLPDKGRSNFKKAEEFIKSKYTNAVILNPAILPDNLNPESYMPICLAMLQQADTIALLPGWRASGGASLECEYANYQNKAIVELQDIGFEVKD